MGERWDMPRDALWARYQIPQRPSKKNGGPHSRSKSGSGPFLMYCARVACASRALRMRISW